MPLNTRTAAQIARNHGLTLSDAQALAVLADDEDEANELAAMFADDPEAAEADRGRDIADRIGSY